MEADFTSFSTLPDDDLDDIYANNDYSAYHSLHPEIHDLTCVDDEDEDNVPAGAAGDGDGAGAGADAADNDQVTLKSDNKHHKQHRSKRSRGHEERSSGHGRSRKKRDRRVPGNELFYRLVLAWKLAHLSASEDHRELLGLRRLAPFPSRFQSADEYYDCLTELTVEECRASVAAEYTLHSKSDFQRCRKMTWRLQMTCSLSQLLEHQNRNPLVLLQFNCFECDAETTKPGSLLVFRTAKTSQSTTSNRYSNHNNSNNSNNNSKYSNRTYSNNNRENSEPMANIDMLAAIAQSSEAIALQQSSYKDTVPIWVSRSYLEEASLSQHFVHNAEWSVFCLTSVISYQRMFVACGLDRPMPPFFMKLLGLKSSKHIKFDEGEAAAVNDGSDEDTCGRENDACDNQDIIEFIEPEREEEIDSDVELIFDSKSGYDIRDLKVPMDAESGERHVTTSASSGLDIALMRALNPSQVNALTSCYKDLCGPTTAGEGHLKLIQGPPGCGKTHFLVSLLECLVHENKRCLVSAPSNKAVCVALEQFLTSRSAQFYRDQPIYHNRDMQSADYLWRPRGMCLVIGVEDKIGNCTTATESFSNGNGVLVHRPPKTHMGDLQDIWRNKIALHNTLPGKFPYPQLQDILHAAYAATATSTNPSGAFTVSSSDVMPQSILPEAITTLTNPLIHPSNAGDVMAYTYAPRMSAAMDALAKYTELLINSLSVRFEDILSSTSGSNLLSHPTVISDLSYLRLVIRTFSCELFTLFDVLYSLVPNLFISFIDKSYCELRCDFMDLQMTSEEMAFIGATAASAAAAASTTMRLPISQQQLTSVKSKFAAVKKSLDAIALTMAPHGDLARSFPEHSLESVDVIFCTLAYTGHSTLKRRICHSSGIHALIVDEAAQSLEPELAVALSCQPRNLVLIGDPQQLPATILSQTANRLGWGKSAMQRLFAASNLPSYLLDTQYRMHPMISEYPNRAYYRGQLKNAPWVMERIDNCLPPLREHMKNTTWMGHFSFINVNGKEYGNGGRLGSSMSNPCEAEFIARLLKTWHMSRNFNVVQQVCVVTFYSGQVACIQQKLRHVFSPLVSSKIRVMTVDSFQGSECDCVVLSFVRCNPQSVVGFVNDYQRLNVALTRARYVLMAVGHEQTLRQDNYRDYNYKARGRRYVDPQVEGSSSAASSTGASEAGGSEVVVSDHLRRFMHFSKDANRIFEASEIEQSL